MCFVSATNSHFGFGQLSGKPRCIACTHARCDFQQNLICVRIVIYPKWFVRSLANIIFQYSPSIASNCAHFYKDIILFSLEFYVLHNMISDRFRVKINEWNYGNTAKKTGDAVRAQNAVAEKHSSERHLQHMPRSVYHWSLKYVQFKFAACV